MARAGSAAVRRRHGGSGQDPGPGRRLAGAALRVLPRPLVLAAGRAALARGGGRASWHRLGVVLERTGSPDHAEAAYRRALAQDASSAASRSHLVRLLAGQERWADAAEALEAAPDLDAGERLRLGRLRERAQDWPGAERAYRAALAQHPSPGVRPERRLSQVLARQERWPEAAATLEQALERDDGPVQEWVRLGRLRERAQDWPGAERAYRSGLVRDPRHAAAHARLVQALVRQERWADAAQALERSLELDHGSVQGWERLGRLRERAGDRAGARAAYRAALARDTLAGAVDAQLLEGRGGRFVPRRRLARFLGEHLEEVRALAAVPTPETSPERRRLFMYWSQGWSEAPPLVRLCAQELLARHPDDVVLLDDEQLPAWVDLPEHVRRKTLSDRTALSDLVRVELLWRHGGVWLDATCLVQDDLLERLPPLMPEGFFAFRRSDRRIASWVMASERQGYVVAMLRAALHVYWRAFDRHIDYFVLHHLFEALTLLDEEFRRHWQATPPQRARPAHRLQRALLEPYDEERLAQLLRRSSVHKLTRKLPQEAAQADTMLAGLLRRLEAPPGDAQAGDRCGAASQASTTTTSGPAATT